MGVADDGKGCLLRPGMQGDEQEHEGDKEQGRLAIHEFTIPQQKEKKKRVMDIQWV
jgi:hypothetical protein